jgi:hypothetical protein
MAMSSIEHIQARIAPLRARLTAHSLYSSIRTQAHLHIFMESHVFAVWDFMSLLKALQIQLTSISLPWFPTRWPDSRRFINEIVLGEESDLYQGRSVSHFELYLEAMQECDADAASIRNLLEKTTRGPCDMSIALASAPTAARQFVGSTFELIREGRLHALAAAFTFGREDVIPDVFRKIVGDIDVQLAGRLKKFIWYLNRHIEVDGADHGPLSLRMITDLCGADRKLWDEAASAAESAILARLSFWDRILAQIQES